MAVFEISRAFLVIPRTQLLGSLENATPAALINR
jgi:hypothetical protein